MDAKTKDASRRFPVDRQRRLRECSDGACVDVNPSLRIDHIEVYESLSKDVLANTGNGMGSL